MTASAQLIWGGAAIRVDSAGRSTVIRRKDLDAVIGQVIDPDTDRLVDARVEAGELYVATATATAKVSLNGRVDAVLVIEGARIMTCDGPEGVGIIEDSSIVCQGSRIAWVGPSSQIANSSVDLADAIRVSARGRLVSPGLIDCHAHPIFAGDRAGEFAMRAAGRGYLEIAAAGGGINATLGPTRAASIETLAALTFGRMSRAFAAGTTTCEAKSGYDLTVDGELRLLEVARLVDALCPVDLSPTLLGAHLVPPERKDDRVGYVADVAGDMVTRAAAESLATAIDVYCDEGAFTLGEAEQILRAGQAAGLHVRAHVGQFADLGGPQLIAELGGLSADHLEQVSAEGIEAMATAGVVAVMLPGACVQLRQEPPPVQALRAAGVAMAVASDMNPGSIKCEVLPLPMWLATTHYGMTVEEAWRGVTCTAAAVLGRDDIGVIRPGAAADLVLWDCDDPAAVPYECGRNLVVGVIKSGRPHFVSEGELRR